MRYLITHPSGEVLFVTEADSIRAAANLYMDEIDIAPYVDDEYVTSLSEEEGTFILSNGWFHVRPDTVRRYLDVRYDITGLSSEEVSSLAGEVSAQAERSEGHPSVEVELETNEVPESEVPHA